MKKPFKIAVLSAVIAAAVLCCCSCGDKKPTPEEEGIVPYEQFTVPTGKDCEMDLTAVSIQLKNSKVFEIQTEHDKYNGKTVRIDGRFKVITHNGSNIFCCEFPNLEDEYDMALEFILESDKKYPDDYPKVGDPITVLGTLQKYESGIRLINAKLVTNG